MPTEQEVLQLTLSEWENSDLRSLLATLQEQRLVSQRLTVNLMVLRFALRHAERLRAALAAGEDITPLL